MKIVVIGTFPEDISFIKGGVEASVYGLAKTLKDKLSVKVISIPSRASESTKIKSDIIDGINVDYLSTKKFLALGILHIPFILKNIDKTDIVHIHATGLLQFLLLLILRIKGINNVWTLHGITEKETLNKYQKNKNLSNLLRYFFYLLIERLSIRIARKIIVDTEYVKSEIGDIPKISVIPQGIFCEEFVDINKERDENLLLSIGVLNPRKGHHLTIESFAIVKKKFPFAKLVIAGAAPVNNYYEELQKLVIKLDLRDSVKFLINIPRSEIVALLKTANIFVLHSQEESQGIAICEALACGLPIVATKIGGIVNVVNDGSDGILVEYGNVEKFAKAISDIMTNKDLYNKISDNARVASNRFDWKNIAHDIIQVYYK
ncbi:MAG: glycosyltransferase family 4 protein [Pseudomonadota bacterium]